MNHISNSSSILFLYIVQQISKCLNRCLYSGALLGDHLFEQLFLEKAAPVIIYIWPLFSFYRALGLANRASFDPTRVPITVVPLKRSDKPPFFKLPPFPSILDCLSTSMPSFPVNLASKSLGTLRYSQNLFLLLRLFDSIGGPLFVLLVLFVPQSMKFTL